MGSKNTPSNQEIQKVILKCTKPCDGDFNFSPEMPQFHELLHILIACKYQGAGCIVNEYLKDIKEHEERCLYRTISCPMLNKEERKAFCESVQPVKLLVHLAEHHYSDCVFTELYLPFNVEEDIQVSKVITIDQDVILCCVKSDGQNLQASLFSIRKINTYVNCNISLMGDDVIWGKQNITLSNAYSGYDEHGGESAVFQLEKLIKAKNLFDDIFIRVECNILANQGINPPESREFFKKIICNNCGDLLTSYYYECNMAHIHCSACYDWEKSCNTCNNPIQGNQINFALQNSLEKNKYPCQNQPFGCKQYVSYFTSNHELLCPFKVFHCALCSFKFNGKYDEFISHLKENHIDYILNTNVYNATDMNQKLRYMFVFGSVFLCCIIDKRICSIDWISSSDLDHCFRFEVHFGYDNTKICFSVDTGCRNVTYAVDYYKSIYNTIKKKATFTLCKKAICDVQKVSFTIRKL